MKDLADEVRRWIADEPVSIYRDPFIVHALRWARRNRTAVASLSAALLAGVIGLGAVTAVTTRANARLNDANHEIDNQRLKAVNALAAESIARAEAGHRLVQGRESIDTLLTGVAKGLGEASRRPESWSLAISWRKQQGNTGSSRPRRETTPLCGW